jgi:hypothetical protein
MAPRARTALGDAARDGLRQRRRVAVRAEGGEAGGGGRGVGTQPGNAAPHSPTQLLLPVLATRPPSALHPPPPRLPRPPGVQHGHVGRAQRLDLRIRPRAVLPHQLVQAGAHDGAVLRRKRVREQHVAAAAAAVAAAVVHARERAQRGAPRLGHRGQEVRRPQAPRARRGRERQLVERRGRGLGDGRKHAVAWVGRSRV